MNVQRGYRAGQWLFVGYSGLLTGYGVLQLARTPDGHGPSTNLAGVFGLTLIGLMGAMYVLGVLCVLSDPGMGPRRRRRWLLVTVFVPVTGSIILFLARWFREP